ncbi:Integrase, catalytic core [Cucumis melo var. makuwa]|uniref:Integrase, catalytic core n=1 Tax=Cucumis melo var. makuwa TaxID=1194695 RepID=A0A5A7U7G5_CUCMM|nr:Integrase, catalytic core [Cucumis melo var. makuwa]TYK03534.1 Integrase, catalytic core [Cucumis melo var. makuwa]
MAEEIETRERTKTWTIVSLPKDHHTIGSKWVYKVKYKPDGTIDRYKARLVAKGYSQQEGIDFSDTFSPVAKISTVKIFLALATSYNWSISQMDINNAFLNGDLFEEVHMTLPLELSPSVINSVKDTLKAHFKLKDLGQAKYFLGLELSRPTAAPMDPNMKLCKPEGEQLSKEDATCYRRLIVYTCLIRGLTPSLKPIPAQPTKNHLDAAHHLLKYLKGSPGQDQSQDFCIFLEDSIISCKSKKQATVSRSSAEVKYRALAAVTNEPIWITQLLTDFKVKTLMATTVFCDNQAAIAIASNPTFHERTKHIEIDCYFVLDKIVGGFLKVLPIKTSLQLADMFTKALPSSTLNKLISKLGMEDIHRPT